MQQIAGFVVGALYDVTVVIHVFTNGSTIDADVAGEAKINVSFGECTLVSLNGLVEGKEGIVPSRTEGHEQYGLVLARLCLLISNQLIVGRILRD